jgi:SAM-dependent methyltransferase
VGPRPSGTAGHGPPPRPLGSGASRLAGELAIEIAESGCRVEYNADGTWPSAASETATLTVVAGEVALANRRGPPSGPHGVGPLYLHQDQPRCSATKQLGVPLPYFGRARLADVIDPVTCDGSLGELPPAEEGLHVSQADESSGATDSDIGKVLGNTRLQSDVLEDLTSARNYQAWLTSLARPYLGEHPIELGSGLGYYAAAWLADGLPRITVTEADPERLAQLEQRFAGDSRVSVSTLDINRPRVDANYSCFVSFNVLEHLPDDVAALKAARTIVRPGGAVVNFVPAFEFAMGRFDRRIGHVRRYRAEEMRKKLLAVGLVPQAVRYVNGPGLLAWFVGIRLLRMTPGEGPVLSLWDTHVVPRVRRLEATRQPPFGQSVFSVARVPDR